MWLKLSKYWFAAMGLLFVINASADIVVSDKSIFVGAWVLESTRLTLKNGSKDTNETWEFKGDGTLYFNSG